MIRRCRYSGDAYRYYNGRGVKVCRRWETSFENFYADLGTKPMGPYSIDRIDPDGDYEPGNVRWADRKTQARNTRRSRLVEFAGAKVPLAEAAEKVGLKYATLRSRLNRGLSTEMAMTMTVANGAEQRRRKLIENNKQRAALAEKDGQERRRRLADIGRRSGL
jgi:hypothetical protein